MPQISMKAELPTTCDKDSTKATTVVDDFQQLEWEADDLQAWYLLAISETS